MTCTLFNSVNSFSAFMVESFLEELREIIEEKKGDEKKIELNRMCKKLKNLTSAQPNSSQLISPEIFSLILMGYNDNKNYDSMVSLSVNMYCLPGLCKVPKCIILLC